MRTKSAISFLLLASVLVAACKTETERSNCANIQIDPHLTAVTEKYLIEHIGEANFGGKVFCAQLVLEIEKSGDRVVKEYLYVSCQEYSIVAGVPKEGTGSQVPVVLSVEQKGGIDAITNHKVPRDGSENAHHIEGLFPPEVRKCIYSLETSNSLLSDTAGQAKAYFARPDK